MHGLMRGYYPTLMSPHAPTEAKDAAVVVTVDTSVVLNGLMRGYYPTLMSSFAPTEAKDATVVVTVDTLVVLNRFWVFQLK